jgi:GTP-binding protein
LSDQDKKIAALAEEKGCGVIFALNKWDQMPTIKNTFNAVRDRLRYMFGQMEYAPVIAVSGATGEGVGEMLNTAIKMRNQLERHLETSTVNELLEKWQNQNPPPASPSARFKIKYGVQTSANPVVFKLFVSRPDAFSEAYRSYIRKCFQRDAGFSLIPVRIDAVPSRRKRGEDTNA